MKTRKELHPQVRKVYTCEVETCPKCASPLILCGYDSGDKTVQTLTMVMDIAYRPKRCSNLDCSENQKIIRSAEWLQIAPLHCTYGYDVIATIGWQRQSQCQHFAEIWEHLKPRIKISESEVRYLYYERYHALLACHEREHMDQLNYASEHGGLLLSTDGLAPEGGEPQLWVVRELRTSLTLRSGWLSKQDHTAFENFLRPIADLGLQVAAILSDKQKGLLPAVEKIFPGKAHAYCQPHYLKNIAEPIAGADEEMKVTLRKAVRGAVGDLIRAEHVENKGVLTVTGLVPTPVAEEQASKTVQTNLMEQKGMVEEKLLSLETDKHLPKTYPDTPQANLAKAEQKKIVTTCSSHQTENKLPSATDLEVTRTDLIEEERAEIVEALKRRTRYLLTLKGRPPFRLAGIEMYERLTEVSECLGSMLAHVPDNRLTRLQQGIDQSLAQVAHTYNDLRRAGDWLVDISDLLDTEDKEPRTGAEVREELFRYVDDILEQALGNAVLLTFASKIERTTRSYKKGLFHTYDIDGLPPSNNERESEFRDLNRRLLRTTGQKGATRRLIQRSGAWEVIPRPGTFAETVAALSRVESNELRKERERVRTHRKRFRLHTRSAKQSRKQLQGLVKQWLHLPPPDGPPE